MVGDTCLGNELLEFRFYLEVVLCGFHGLASGSTAKECI